MGGPLPSPAAQPQVKVEAPKPVIVAPQKPVEPVNATKAVVKAPEPAPANATKAVVNTTPATPANATKAVVNTTPATPANATKAVVNTTPANSTQAVVKAEPIVAQVDAIARITE